MRRCKRPERASQVRRASAIRQRRNEEKTAGRCIRGKPSTTVRRQQETLPEFCRPPFAFPPDVAGGASVAQARRAERLGVIFGNKQSN
jgi:hypothetical protein